MSAIQKITYGLYVITVNDGAKDSGCICNTVTQVTTSPNRIAITLNKNNYTTEVIEKTGCFNVSIINEDADFSLFKRFGFQSGRDNDKFAGFDNTVRTENNLLYVTEGINSFICAKVVSAMDIGTHMLYIADVVDSGDLSDVPSATYSYYHTNIKPKPQEKKEDGTIWRCKICGYEYKGESLPADFECPICKHGPEDFEKIN